MAPATSSNSTPPQRAGQNFVLGVHGVRYQSKDVARAAEFYTTYLGFTLERQQLPAFASIAHGLHWNYRMTEQTAAIGLAQLERARGYVAELVEIGELYDEAVKNCSWLTLQRGPGHARFQDRGGFRRPKPGPGPGQSGRFGQRQTCFKPKMGKMALDLT